MRPLGVTLVGLYQLVRGLISLLFGLCILLFTGLAARLMSLAAEGNAVQRFLSISGHVAGIGILVFAVAQMLAGFGVLQMENWGRLLALFFSAVGLVLVLPWMLHWHIFSLFFGVINAACIFYLASPPVKRAFHADDRPMRVAA